MIQLPTMSEINFNDFLKVEIRVGQVVAASSPDWSNKLLEFKVNFGDEIGEKTIFSGIKKWHQPEFFIDKKFLFVTNLPERKMGEGISQGMMLMVDNEEKPELIVLSSEAEIGQRVA